MYDVLNDVIDELTAPGQMFEMSEVEVRGQTLRLSGSAESQYQEWQRLMREIWATETGLPVDPNLPGAATVESETGGGSSNIPPEQN